MVAVRCRPALRSELDNGNSFKKLICDAGAKGVSAWNERSNAYKTAKFDIVPD